MLATLLNNENFNYDELVYLLKTGKTEAATIFKKAGEVKQQHVGNKVHFRGLLEFSNICEKNCYYCGIRKDNSTIKRYMVTADEALYVMRSVYEEHGLASFVIQSGEITGRAFIDRIGRIVKEMKKISHGHIAITLSCGEQEDDVYKYWYDCGVERYLLRIETSNRALYERIHPGDEKHLFDRRMAALDSIQRIGFQVGTGVMIGLPFQTVETLAADLLFMKKRGIDMVGMGPYVIHENTPMFAYRDFLTESEERVFLTMKMIALLRIMMKNINIASTTALETLHPGAKIQALAYGANVIMPNISPAKYHSEYDLYKNKHLAQNTNETTSIAMVQQLRTKGYTVDLSDRGDSLYFSHRRQNSHNTIGCH